MHVNSLPCCAPSASPAPDAIAIRFAVRVPGDQGGKGHHPPTSTPRRQRLSRIGPYAALETTNGSPVGFGIIIDRSALLLAWFLAFLSKLDTTRGPSVGCFSTCILTQAVGTDLGVGRTLSAHESKDGLWCRLRLQSPASSCFAVPGRRPANSRRYNVLCIDIPLSPIPVGVYCTIPKYDR
jgi:hypothetical protein